MAEYLRLERIADLWAKDLARRHKLADAKCRVQLPPTPRSGCSFYLDGISLHAWKEGRAPSRSIGVILSFANEIDITGDRLVIVGGKWVKVGDLFEVETPGGVYAFDCEALGEADYVTAQCVWARDWPSIQARATYPKRRYAVLGPKAELDLGRAFASGFVRARHNGKPLSLARLAAAIREFARADLQAMAAAR